MPSSRIIKKETDPNIAETLKAHDQLVEKRRPFEQVWIEIAQYLHPRINNFQDDNQQGKKRTNYILDSSPLRSVRVASDGYQAYMFPRSAPWFKFGFVQEQLTEKQDVKFFLRDCEKVIYSELARSPFYNEGGLVIDNGITIGTSTCYAEPNDAERCTNYLSLHPKEVYIARNKFGVVDTVHRRFLMTGRNILEAFQHDGIEDKLTKQTIERLEKNPYENNAVLHLVMPIADRLAAKIAKVKKPWLSLYILEDEQIELRNAGYDEFPFMVWCCSLNTDEDYGRSPGWDALPDVKRLQKIVKDIMQGAESQARPSKFGPAELEDVADFSPGSYIPYRDFMRRIVPIETTLNLQHAELLAQQIRAVINDHFDVPFFLMFSQREKLQKTATEVAEIAGERAALMGTRAGRIETDFLDTAIELAVRNAARAGRLPALPPTLRNLPQADFKITYIGPLATLQKRYHGQQNITTTFMQATPILELFREARFVINAKGAVRSLLTEGGMPPEGINEEDEVVKLEQAAAAAEQAQQTAEMVKNLGQGMGGLSKAPEEGSPAQTMGARQPVGAAGAK